MGDGRYYTYDQFYAVAFLTVMLSGIAIQGVISHYQEYRRGRRAVLIAHLTLGLAAIMRLTAEVAVSPERVFFARQAELLCIMATELSALYLTGLGASLPRMLLSGLLLMLPAAASIAGPPLLLMDTQTLTAGAYGPGYQLFTGGVALLAFFLALQSSK